MDDPAAQLLKQVLETGTSGLLLFFIIKAYADLKVVFTERMKWMSDQLTRYMERDSAIVVKTAETGLEIASKWASFPPPALK